MTKSSQAANVDEIQAALHAWLKPKGFRKLVGKRRPGSRAYAGARSFVTLVVSDLDRARRFYSNGLGWAAALDAAGEVAMIHVGDRLVRSLWAESAARAENGNVTRGGTLPFTLAHNVMSPAEVDAVLKTARAAGGQRARRRTARLGRLQRLLHRP
jgi:catechol 2,3-dioxygenase-like lactoylglutathione lyase family enzyme